MILSRLYFSTYMQSAVNATTARNVIQVNKMQYLLCKEQNLLTEIWHLLLICQTDMYSKEEKFE